MQIQSISEYTNIIETIYEQLKINSDDKETLAFRGQSAQNFQLTPYLGRYGVEKEREIIQMAKTSYPETFKEGYSPLVLLSLLQHYGIPTRLMDITQNALVGLYFACNENPQKNGQVYVFRYQKRLPEDIAIENVIADSYRLMHPSIPQMPIDNFCRNAAKMHQNTFSWVDGSIEEYIKSKITHIYFIRLPRLIYRQTVQAGNYILFSNCIENNYVIPKISPITENDPHIVATIEIAANAKKKIMAELEYFGITEMQLFPENIDKGCRWLRTKLEE